VEEDVPLRGQAGNADEEDGERAQATMTQPLWK